MRQVEIMVLDRETIHAAVERARKRKGSGPATIVGFLVDELEAASRAAGNNYARDLEDASVPVAEQVVQVTGDQLANVRAGIIEMIEDVAMGQAFLSEATCMTPEQEQAMLAEHETKRVEAFAAAKAEILEGTAELPTTQKH